jgi:hypothetical protein
METKMGGRALWPTHPCNSVPSRVPLQDDDLEPMVQVGQQTGLQAFRSFANMHNGTQYHRPEVMIKGQGLYVPLANTTEGKVSIAGLA